jgi:hypothetical protein
VLRNVRASTHNRLNGFLRFYPQRALSMILCFASNVVLPAARRATAKRENPRKIKA